MAELAARLAALQSEHQAQLERQEETPPMSVVEDGREAVWAWLRLGDAVKDIEGHVAAEAHYRGALALVEQLVAERAQQELRAWLGATIEDGTTSGQPAAGSSATGGVLVTAVYPGGPAERAGLRAGDIVPAIDGEPVVTAAQMSARVGGRAGPWRLSVRRAGKSFMMVVSGAARAGEREAGPADLQRVLSVSFERLGDALLKQGHRALAAAEFGRALAIAEGRAKARPQEPDRRREVAAVLERLSAAQDQAASRASLERALAILRQLGGEGHGDADLANTIGCYLLLAGRFAEADAHFAAWVRATPRSAPLYSHYLGNLANAKLLLGRVDEALVLYRDCLTFPGLREAIAGDLAELRDTCGRRCFLQRVQGSFGLRAVPRMRAAGKAAPRPRPPPRRAHRVRRAPGRRPARARPRRRPRARLERAAIRDPGLPTEG